MRRRTVEEQLTAQQPQTFVTIVLDGAPLAALVAQLGSTRNPIYKTLFEAHLRCMPLSSLMDLWEPTARGA